MKNPYRSCSVSKEELQRIENLRKAFFVLHEIIIENCPVSREQSLVITNLETAAMWATKSITHNDSGSASD